MKKKMIISVSILVVFIVGWIIGSGFIQRNDVVLNDYSVSEDGQEIHLQINVVSSMGYTRGFKDNGGGVKPHYLVFYSAFGGFNNRLGAKDEFTLKLHSDDTEIFFYRGDGGYELVLHKDEISGQWERP